MLIDMKMLGRNIGAKGWAGLLLLLLLLFYRLLKNVDVWYHRYDINGPIHLFGSVYCRCCCLLRSIMEQNRPPPPASLPRA